MNDAEEKPPVAQPRWVTNAIFNVLGGLTVSFWGGLIWLGLSTFSGR